MSINLEAHLSRDARHVALPQLGPDGQARIRAGKVLLIGAGGIGNAVAAYIAAAGVGELIVADFDRVDETNLGRQFLFGPADVGRTKTEVLAERLHAINPEVHVEQSVLRVDAENIEDLIRGADVVLDGSDNLRTRLTVSDACVRGSRALVAGSAIRLEGQVATFGPDYAQSPCYRCAYTDADESLEDCAGNGVFGPVPGVVGSLMAVDALKLLAQLPVQLGHLTLFDGTSSEFRSIRVRKNVSCPACS